MWGFVALAFMIGLAADHKKYAAIGLLCIAIAVFWFLNPYTRIVDLPRMAGEFALTVAGAFAYLALWFAFGRFLKKRYLDTWPFWTGNIPKDTDALRQAED